MIKRITVINRAANITPPPPSLNGKDLPTTVLWSTRETAGCYIPFWGNVPKVLGAKEGYLVSFLIILTWKVGFSSGTSTPP
jgi:hypothetical protein